MEKKFQEFDYCEDRINEMASEYEEVAMLGLMGQFKRFKEDFEELLTKNNYFYFDYDLGEIGYHWNMSNPENQKLVENMRKVTKDFKEAIDKAYACCLGATGERLQKGS